MGTEEGDVQDFEFLQNLRFEDVVDRFKLGAAATDIARNEVAELLHDTVTEGEAEMLDDEGVEFLEFLQGRFAKRMVDFRLVV